MVTTSLQNRSSLPAFSQIQVENFESSLDILLSKNQTQLDTLLKKHQQENLAYTWESLMQPLESMDDTLNMLWSPIQHLHSVADSEVLRNVYKACLPKLSEYQVALYQNEALFHAVDTIKNSSEFEKLEPAQKKIIENMLRDFKLAGVHLSPEIKKKFAELNKKLSQLSTQFQENLLDATQNWKKLITNISELSGVPEHALSMAKQAAEKADVSGWLFTLDMPSYDAIITYADSRELRQEFYSAYVTRASDQGPNAGKWDNTKIINDILNARHEMIKLLNFNNYAEYSLATKMAKTPEEVLNFIHELSDACLNQARQEFSELAQFAKKQGGIENLEAWDIPYFSEKLRQHAYAVATEDFRPYFPENQVLKGLFEIIFKIYGMRVERIESADVWRDDVKLFAIYDQNHTLRGYFYLDLYAQAAKRDGAWHDDCRVRRKLSTHDIQVPISFINCNFNAPIGNEPALLSHDDVITLFHEFGHGLQHLLTLIDYASVSGINGVPWDAVEVASQFMESWCWEKQSVDLIAKHYKTQQPLPSELFDKLIKAKNFQSAMQMVRQLQFALFDFRLHLEHDPNQKDQTQTILKQVREKFFIFPTPEFNRFQHSFSHIFAGGYAAGYYSYKWAEVLACDAFSLFEERGIFDRKTGESFLHTILETGGAFDPMDLFIQFRGRAPKVDALLKANGIL